VGFLIFSSSCQENEKIINFDEKDAQWMYFEEEKRFYEVSRARKANLKGQKECMVGRAQWHNHAEIL